MNKAIDFKNIYQRKIDYDNNAGSYFFSLQDQGEPNLSIESSAFALDSENQVYEINLGIVLKNINQNKEEVFSLAVYYTSIIQFQGNWEEEEKKEVLYIDGCNALFPYIREAINSNLSKAGIFGFYPPSPDFIEIYETNKDNFKIENIN